jgi:hypothetical protein
MNQTQIPPHFRLSFQPVADVRAMVLGPHVRFGVLTPHLIRLEYSPNDAFEDRASQAFWYRQQAVPDFEVARSDSGIEIETEHLHLSYQDRGVGFAPETLSITLKESGTVWHYGDRDAQNLLGTTRTLDGAKGYVALDQGLLSRSGWAVVDDSSSLVFDAQGWLQSRAAPPEARDLYFFGHGHEFQRCLRDYCRIAGAVPLLPRWALGNWWSRYWAYTQDELMALMNDFCAHDVPLSVCIVDMDWHIVDTGRGYSGWTGYTWNRALFPDPEGFIRRLHDQGLRTALNLHPADGVRPHEEMYVEMAQRMGIDPDTEAPVRFDLADPDFAKAYFEVLHHPQEARGVDFWWIDWQQGELSSLPGLDPLWWLNHLHFRDLGRDGKTRPFIFSRWGGLGNHRYPIGFSGDTYVQWETLAYQPYFTATAANVGYGWWSHDIGGHQLGVEDPELYARWVQFGVFSPIMRLHSTKNAFHERRPWGFDAETLRVTRDALQLRHALIPYLYTMSWRNHQESIPLVQPMYYEHPLQEEAYHCPQQYYFGSELMVAPFVTPAGEHTGLSRQVVWLPPGGNWYHFFSGECFKGGGWYAQYGRLEDIPVFAKTGAIVPLGPKAGWGGVDSPAEFDLRVFAGADNRFVLYEDDGETTDYTYDKYGLTEFSQDWQERRLEFRIAAASGDIAHLPAQRRYHIHFHGVKEPDLVTLEIDGKTKACTCRYDAQTETVYVSGVDVPVTAELRLVLATESDSLLSHRDRVQETCYGLLEAFKLETSAKTGIAERLDELQEDPAMLADYAINLTGEQMRALLEVTCEAGVDLIRQARDEALVLFWNNRENEGITYRYSRWLKAVGELDRRFGSEKGVVPRFKAIIPVPRLSDSDVVGWIARGVEWRVTTNYFDLVAVTYDNMEAGGH